MALFVVLLPAWLWISPLYKQAVGRTAGAFLAFTFEGSKKLLDYEKESDSFVLGHTEMRGKARPSFKGDVIHYNMVILAALILASPGLGLRRKARRLLSAGFILYLVHAFETMAKAEALFAANMGEWSLIHYGKDGAVFWVSVNRLFETFGPQVLPFVLWALFCAPAILSSMGWRYGQAPSPEVPIPGASHPGRGRARNRRG